MSAKEIGEFVASVLALFGLNVAGAAGGAAGALISLRNVEETATRRTKFYTFFSSWAFTLFATPFLVAKLEWGQTATGFLALVLGIYGMAAVTEGFALFKSGFVGEVIRGIITKRSA